MGYYVHMVKASTFVDSFSSSASVSTFFIFSKYLCIIYQTTKLKNFKDYTPKLYD